MGKRTHTSATGKNPAALVRLLPPVLTVTAPPPILLLAQLPPLSEGPASRNANITVTATTAYTEVVTPSFSSRATGPARNDHTAIAGYSRGSKALALQIASDSSRRHAARDDLKSKAYTPGSVAAREAKLETWVDISHAAGFQILPDDLSRSPQSSCSQSLAASKQQATKTQTPTST